MNSKTRDPLSRFLGAVHRRMMIVRAVEGAGAGLAISAGLSLILAVALLWIGRDAMQLCVVSLLAGAIVGAAWQMLRRPTMLQAAVEADRQLQLADLLATAWLRGGDDDQWQRAVMAMAEQRCQSISPSAVMIARFGTRAWSGIGLSAALVLTIGALSTSPRPAPASTPDVLSAVMRGAREADSHLQTPSPSTAVQVGARDPRRVAPLSPDETKTMGARASNPVHAPGTKAGGGQAFAQTSNPQVAVRPHPASAVGSSEANAAESGGGGADDFSSGQGGRSTAGSVAAPDAPASAEPESPGSSPQAKAAAEDRIRDGRIKDGYRDVVRRYFDGR